MSNDRHWAFDADRLRMQAELAHGREGLGTPVVPALRCVQQGLSSAEGILDSWLMTESAYEQIRECVDAVYRSYSTRGTPNDRRTVQPYLFFGGRCEEALAFYRTALGAQVDILIKYKESPEPPPPGMLPPGFEDKVMHSSFRIGQTLIMASDGCSAEKTDFQGFSLSLSVSSEAEADRYFSALGFFRFFRFFRLNCRFQV